MEIIIIFLLIALNAFFSLSEIALISSKKVKLEVLRESHPRRVDLVCRLVDDSESFLSSIQVGITLIGIINGFYGGDKLAVYLKPLFSTFIANDAVALQLAGIVGILLITFFSIVWGELTPKSMALSNPEKSAIKVAPIIYLFSKTFFPVVKLLSITTKFTNKILGIKEPENHVTEEELRSMIKIASEEGVIEEEQNEIHEKLFYFSDKRAKHIMTHRSEVEWIDIHQSETEFEKVLLVLKNSKVLVCDKQLDNYIGVLNVKEYLIAKMTQKSITIEDMLSKPIVFPESVDAQEILTEMRKRQCYFCLIVDEFGTMEGIVTMHDVMENIVGEIPEEEEVVEPDIVVREDNSVLVNGDAPIEVLMDVIDGLEVDFEEIDYATVAGFVLEHLEHLPQVGSQFEHLGYRVEIVDIDHNRIDKILVTKLPKK